MYTKLTKITNIDGADCVTCAFYGTDQCRIHTDNISGCSQCKVLGAIINQLHAFEEIVEANNLDDEK